jgi:Zn-dependent protease
MDILIEYLVIIPAILVAISVHEFGHAAVAYMLGDSTAKDYGRMTLDPIKHIDPIGFLMLLIARIGWARPVPVNPTNFKNERIGNILVSLAGSFFNIVTAVLFIYIINYNNINIFALNEMLDAIVMYNIGFGAFNLLPIPPLDGWGVVSSLLPRSASEFAYKFESMGSIILILLIFTNTFSILLNPIYGVISTIISFVVI